MQLLRRAQASILGMPEVDHAAVTVGLPLDGGSFSASVYVPGGDSVPTLQGQGPFVSAVGEDYFATVGTRLLRGHPITDANGESSDLVAVINQTMASTLWPGQDPLDRCVMVGGRDEPCRRIVGVVQDIHRVGLVEPASFQIYLPVGQQRLFSGGALVSGPFAGHASTRPPCARPCSTRRRSCV